MQYTVNFADATAVFDLLAPTPLVVYTGWQKMVVELEKAMGYEKEIAYFLDCVARGERPQIVTIRHAADAIRIIEAEERSVVRGRPIRV